MNEGGNKVNTCPGWGDGLQSLNVLGCPIFRYKPLFEKVGEGHGDEEIEGEAEGAGLEVEEARSEEGGGEAGGLVEDVGGEGEGDEGEAPEGVAGNPEGGNVPGEVSLVVGEGGEGRKREDEEEGGREEEGAAEAGEENVEGEEEIDEEG